MQQRCTECNALSSEQALGSALRSCSSFFLALGHPSRRSQYVHRSFHPEFSFRTRAPESPAQRRKAATDLLRCRVRTPPDRAAHHHGRQRARRRHPDQLPRHQVLLGLPVHHLRPQLRPGGHRRRLGHRHREHRRRHAVAHAATARTSSTPTGAGTTSTSACRKPCASAASTPAASASRTTRCR